MNNPSSINSGTFSDPHQCCISTQWNSTSINAPHAFSWAANSSIPVSSAARTSINSPHSPHNTESKQQPVTSNTQKPKDFFQLYKTKTSMNLASDATSPQIRPNNRPSANCPTAPKQFRPAPSSQNDVRRHQGEPAGSEDAPPPYSGPQSHPRSRP